MGSTETQADGSFEMEFDDAYFKELFLDRSPDLFLKVFHNNTLITSTEDSVLWNMKSGKTNIEIEVDMPVEDKIFKIHGHMLQADGTPVEGITVKAFDKDLRQESVLGEAATDSDGKYAISYTAEQLSQADKTNADLIVCAYDDSGEEVAASKIILSASANETVELIIGNETYRGPAEYARISKQLAPLLRDIASADLTADEVTYLAGKTGVDPVHIAYFVKSARLEQKSDINAEIFYGLFRQNLPTSLTALIAQDPAIQKRALKSAARDNIISIDREAEIEQTLVKLRSRIVDHVFESPEIPERHSLSELFDTGDLSPDLQRSFMEAYVAHQGPIEEFWQGLREDVAFGDSTVENIQFTIQLGALTLNHVPLVNVLQQQHQSGSVESIRDLARLTQQDWIALINQQIDDKPVGFPPMVPGETDEEKIATYALTMTRIMEDAFPTAVISYRIKTDDFEHAQTVADFLQANPGFDFRRMRIDRYLAENEEALSGIDNREAVVGQLKGIQRLFNVAPRFDKYKTIHTLLADGVNSAYAIRRMGIGAFKRKYIGSFDDEEFELIYAQSDQSAAMSQNIYAKHGSELAIPTGVTPEQPEFVEGIPEWRSLFGSLALCSCEHCRSVYSPAAYLVDILHFLSQRETEGKSALQVLFERRSDIGEIELSCKNTNTVLPYVDLVNEAMENAVAPNGAVYQTSGRAEELRVEPEHVNNAAYATLAEANYPWPLPFSLRTEEARIYLNHLGVPRHELMAIMRQAQTAETDLDIAIEHLGLTQLQRDIITVITGDTSEPLRQFWGMNQAEWQAWQDDPKVSILLNQSKLDYESLTRLLAVAFINPDNEMQVEFPDAGCNLDEATIFNLSEAALDRMHRFMRLQRILGLSIRELDAALRALPDHDLSNEFLLDLSHVLRIQQQLNTSFITMLSWWSDIDTISDDSEPSLYETLFLNKAVSNPVNEAFQLDDMVNNSFGIDEHVATVLAGLEISDEELALLLAYKKPGHAFNLLTDSLLSLTHLSRLFAAVSLARALKLSIRDFLILLDLGGINPFENTAATLRFVELANRVKASDFAISELNYLLRHQDVSYVIIAPSEEQTGLLLGELRAGLQKIAEENIAATDPTGEQIAQALANLFTEPEVDIALAILDGSSTESNTVKNSFIDDYFAEFLDTEDAKEKLVATGPDSIPKDEKEQRFNYVLRPLLTYLGQRNLVKQKLADAYDLDMASCDQLLTHLVPAQSDPVQTAMADFLSFVFINSVEDTLTKTDFLDQFRQFELLGKIATFVTRFKIPPEELAWVFEHGSELGWLDFKILPLEEEASGESLFTAWSRMAQLTELNRGLLSGEYDLSTLFHGLHEVTINSDAQFIAEFSARSGCSESDVEYLIGADGFDLAVPADFQNENAVERMAKLTRAIEVIKRLGVSAEQTWNWNTVLVSDEQALSIKRAVKAKYEDEHWLNIAQPLRDDLREKQRSALIDYLVHTMRYQGVGDANDLFGHFLLDVEMSACMMTSRIKQANSSVQLFVQRCLMNLEPEVQLEPRDAEEWAWMKNYRIWEANRKIFLYPENWIEPELRDDKSPFFKDLENELLQNDVTLDTVESVYLNYLEKLDEVAHLEISGMYEDADAGLLHVFARTRGTPHIYYYRRWVNKAYWTPWERVDVDIQGEHLIPVVYNRRLYLFWPVFIVKADASIPDEGEAEEPSKYYEIQLAWSEYKKGKWQAKRISTEVSQTPATKILPQKSNIRLWASINQELIIFLEVITDDGGLDAVNSPSPFKFFDCNGKIELGHNYFKHLNSIPGTQTRFMRFVEKTGTHALEMVVNGQIETWSLKLYQKTFVFEYLDAIHSNEVLKKTPGTFIVILPHQFRPFVSQASFFYEDDRRTFFVVPRDPFLLHKPLEDELFSNESIKPEFIDSVAEMYLTREESISSGHRRSDTYREEKHVSTLNSGELYVPEETMVQDMVMSGRVEEIIAGKESQNVVPKHQVDKYFRFDNFYHPYVSTLIKQLNRYGIDGLLDPCGDIDEPDLCRQLIRDEFFKDEYVPTDSVEESYPVNEIDFIYGGAYSSYNWELFFHAPFLIANRLSDNQRFAEAQKWYHYIFDPTNVSINEDAPARFWKVKPFYEETGGSHIQHLMQLLGGYSTDPVIQKLQKSLRDQINAWRQDPFKPHIIARLRSIAYQKTIVMKYIDNLIAWSDNLFRRDTIESINEATQLYVLAAQILGKRPVDIPAYEGTVKTIDGEEIKNYNDLADHLDEFSNALIELETALPASAINGEIVDEAPATLVIGPSLFFCIPRNSKLLEYWDTVSDRLFKLRHCMNIEGVVRQLPLFEPPIPPGMLVKAAAAGVDISSALSDLYAPIPHYRYQVMLQKALEFCADVKSLGASLLSTLEKRDAEALALLRSGHELRLLEAVGEVRKQQVKEAEESLEAVKKSKDIAESKRDFYQNRKSRIPNEELNLNKLRSSNSLMDYARIVELMASISYLVPTFDVGIAGVSASPISKIAFGGDQWGRQLQAWASSKRTSASIDSNEANEASIMGGYERRQEEWIFVIEQANKEIIQIDKQIAAAEIRLAITEKDLENHELQIENTKEVDIYMRDKFTNQQLYSWMVSQISTMYFQSYQMAYDLAKRAERAFRREIGDAEATFIEFGYWDSLKKGLLSGDRLHYDLRRMETSYLDKNKREYEITKHISLSMLDPLALVILRATGVCDFEVPEVLYDMDHSGQYFRRIKSVSISLPCIVGPYTSVSAKLSLVSNKYRKNNATPGAQYGENIGNDERFAYNIGAIQSIATSNAQNDSGVFELNFRDERYLPFEGCGAISSWRLELPEEVRQFDYNTISDVIIHMKYSSRDGGSSLKELAETSLKTRLAEIRQQLNQTGLHVAINIKHDLPNEWQLFKKNGAINITIDKSRLPYMAQTIAAAIENVIFIAKIKNNLPTFTISVDGNDTALAKIDEGMLCQGNYPDIDLDTSFELSVAPAQLNNLEELMMMVKFSF